MSASRGPQEEIASATALLSRFDRILASSSLLPTGAGEVIGHSREGRPLHAFRYGRGERRVSLLAGAHADEPVGPRFLRHFVAYLAELPTEDPLIRDWAWWIVPHMNPDGAARNQAWQAGDPSAYSLPLYLGHAVRESPGDDLEFGFPHGTADREARPEARAVWNWWRTAGGTFSLHLSLHGMGFAAGPWFLVEAGWWERLEALRRLCSARVHSLGYVLHDVERRGEKGFVRLARGFTTRPDSGAMRQHFLRQGAAEIATRFRPSSMEAVRALGGDPLTLVSEMPLFLTPGVGEVLGPPDPQAEEWTERIARWRAELAGGREPAQVEMDAAAVGLRAMRVGDQMELQWALIAAGLEAVG